MRQYARLLTPFFVALLVPALAAAADSTAASPAPKWSEKELEQANRQLEQRLAGCSSPNECQERAAQILVAENPGGAFGDLLHERVVSDLGRARDALLANFSKDSPALQARILAIFDAGWDTMPHGSDYLMTQLVTDALESPSADVRRGGARLMAKYALPRIGHVAADAAEDHPELTSAALIAIEITRDPLLTRWTVRRLADGNAEVKAQALRTADAIGRKGVPYIREMLEDPSPAIRGAAVDALLMSAGGDEIPVLQAWQQTHGKDDPQHDEAITKALAGIEAGTWDPKPPARAPLP